MFLPFLNPSVCTFYCELKIRWKEIKELQSSLKLVSIWSFKKTLVESSKRRKIINQMYLVIMWVDLGTVPNCFFFFRHTFFFGWGYIFDTKNLWYWNSLLRIMFALRKSETNTAHKQKHIKTPEDTRRITSKAIRKCLGCSYYFKWGYNSFLPF